MAAKHHAHNSKAFNDASHELEVLVQQRLVARQGALDDVSGVIPQLVVVRDEALPESAAQAPVGQGRAEEPLELNKRTEASEERGACGTNEAQKQSDLARKRIAAGVLRAYPLCLLDGTGCAEDTYLSFLLLLVVQDTKV